MTDKIKEAREALEMWADDVYDRTSHELLDTHAKTILKALSAYEKLQGVDLDTVKEIEERWGDRFLELEEPVPEGMKRGGYVVDIHFLLTQLKSAKLVADIGGGK